MSHLPPLRLPRWSAPLTLPLIPPYPPLPSFTSTPTPVALSPALGLPGGLSWTNVIELVGGFTAVAAGLFVAYLQARRQVNSEEAQRIAASRKEVMDNWTMTRSLMQDTVTELRAEVTALRAEAQSARTAESAADARLREMRDAFRTFGEEALRVAPAAQWSGESLDTLFTLGLRIASVERARDRVSSHVDRIADRVDRIADQADAMEQATAGMGDPPEPKGDADARPDAAGSDSERA